uniref:Uncharacterized protein n=1 Tax=viral metagenome TaxID=1070528 RepID=A0A6C0JV23_9ZZZZ
MYAKIINNQIIEYPYNPENLKLDYPQTSFPASLTPDFLENHNIINIVSKGIPTHNKLTHKVVEIDPTYNTTKKQWEQSYSIVNLSVAESNTIISIIITEISIEVQKRLDDFARTRYYDNILSLCTYANSSNPKFQVEGTYGLQVRDSTWNIIYQIFEDVKNNIREMPLTYEEIESELPILTWPT